MSRESIRIMLEITFHFPSDQDCKEKENKGPFLVSKIRAKNKRAHTHTHVHPKRHDSHISTHDVEAKQC